MAAKFQVSAGAAAGVAVVVVWVFSLAGVDVPADVAVTIAAGVVWLAGVVQARLGARVPTGSPKAAEDD